MFYFKSNSNVEFKFYFHEKNSSLVFNSFRELPSGGSSTCNGSLKIKNGKVTWHHYDDYLFDDSTKEYVRRILKLKAFI